MRCANTGRSETSAFDPRRAPLREDATEADRTILSLLGHLRGPARLDAWEPDAESEVLELSADEARVVLPPIARLERLRRWTDGNGLAPIPWDVDPLTVSCATEEASDGGLIVRLDLVFGREIVDATDVIRALPSGHAILPNRLVAIDPPDAGVILERASGSGRWVVPRDHRNPCIRALAALPAGTWRNPDSLRAVEVLDGVPSPTLRIGDPAPIDARTPPALRFGCLVEFDYGSDLGVASQDPTPVLGPASDARFVRRDPTAETRLAREFLEAGGERRPIDRESGLDGSIEDRRLPDLAASLLDRGWSVLAQGVELRAATGCSASVESGIDWFDLEGGLRFDDALVSFPELLRALRAGERMVALGNGKRGLLPEEWLHRWRLLELAERGDGSSFRFRSNQAWLIEALLDEQSEVVEDEAFREVRRGLARFQRVRAASEPSSFAGVLRTYQREALGWFEFLDRLGLGGCLADDMGLGKTVQVLAFLDARRSLRHGAGRQGPPSLVVAPRSLIVQWIDEAARFAPDLSVLNYSGANRSPRRSIAQGADVWVTTYATLRNDVTLLTRIDFDVVVLDEATAIKNPRSQTAKATRLLRARRRIALTGTPVENRVGDLWSVFEFLNPGMLGRSREFQRLVACGSNRETLDRVKDAIRPFVLRRTKDEVLRELPPKTEDVVLCDLSAVERRRYDEIAEHARRSLLGPEPVERQRKANADLHVLTALLRLRQAACHPGLIDPERRTESSAKLDALLPRLLELTANGHKVLVFSQFVTFLEIVRARLDGLRVRHEVLDGRTRDRQQRVTRFQSNPAIPVFLISLKAGGHGLNLTAADRVFLLDPWWNPAVESQAIDRVHRIGQRRPVVAHRVIARDTVEERILELQAQKRELADALFTTGSGPLQDLKREDLEALLS